MTIGPISNIGASAVPPISRPESTEAPGAPDHDGDQDNAAGPASAAATKGASLATGQVNVKA